MPDENSLTSKILSFSALLSIIVLFFMALSAVFSVIFDAVVVKSIGREKATAYVKSSPLRALIWKELIDGK